MDEARRVIDRLERIDGLRRDGAPSTVLLGEVRRLLREGEEWLAAERASSVGVSDVAEGELDGAADALARCRSAVPASGHTAKEVVGEAAG